MVVPLLEAPKSKLKNVNIVMSIKHFVCGVIMNEDKLFQDEINSILNGKIENTKHLGP